MIQRAVNNKQGVGRRSAVERHIEDGLAPKAAAFRAMEEISGPVIGIALVLSAIFVPTACIPTRSDRWNYMHDRLPG